MTLYLDKAKSEIWLLYENFLSEFNFNRKYCMVNFWRLKKSTIKFILKLMKKLEDERFCELHKEKLVFLEKSKTDFKLKKLCEKCIV